MGFHRASDSIFPALLLAVLTIALTTRSAQAASTGKQDFDANCASCHGFDGKGHGQMLYVRPQVRPPDLTILSRNNGGMFPAGRVCKSINGRNGIPSHERFDMPFWGTAFQREGQEFTPASERDVRARIRKIVDYLRSIQEK